MSADALGLSRMSAICTLLMPPIILRISPAFTPASPWPPLPTLFIGMLLGAAGAWITSLIC